MSWDKPIRSGHDLGVLRFAGPVMEEALAVRSRLEGLPEKRANLPGVSLAMYRQHMRNAADVKKSFETAKFRYEKIETSEVYDNGVLGKEWHSEPKIPTSMGIAHLKLLIEAVIKLREIAIGYGVNLQDL